MKPSLNVGTLQTNNISAKVRYTKIVPKIIKATKFCLNFIQ